MSYILQIDYFNKPLEEDSKLVYKQFDSIFDLVGYLYDCEIEQYGKYRIFEEKRLSISLEDIKEQTNEK